MKRCWDGARQRHAEGVANDIRVRRVVPLECRRSRLYWDGMAEGVEGYMWWKKYMRRHESGRKYQSEKLLEGGDVRCEMCEMDCSTEWRGQRFLGVLSGTQ